MSDETTTPILVTDGGLTRTQPTEYVVLELTEEAGHWQEVARSAGTSAEGAIRTIITKEGTYIAVPLRSWRPTTVRTETTTRVIVEAT